jgi:hypothetical protein
LAQKYTENMEKTPENPEPENQNAAPGANN